MSRKGIEELLQECLAALDHGLTPDECLSAWPDQRPELEPLLREAMTVRIALTVAPKEAFQARLREKMLFVAGREARVAMDHAPEPEFVERTRLRLRNVAGQNAQESLRSVPPPRLAFWMNARRHLLESAADQTRRAAAPRPAPLALRAGMGLAALALAVGVGSYAVFSPGGNGGDSPSVNAQIAALEQQVIEVEQQSAAGKIVPPGILLDLSRRTAQLAEKARTEETSPPLADKLPTLIERQKDVVTAAVAASPAPTALQQAQEHLNQAEANVRVQSARSDTSPQPTTSGSPAPAAAAANPPGTTTAPPAAAITPAVLPAPGQVRVLPLRGDTTFGLKWQEVLTPDFRVVLPDDWHAVALNVDSRGLANLEFPFIRFDGASVTVLIGTSNGQISAIVNGQPLSIRGAGPNARTITVEDLVQSVPLYAREFSHILETAKLTVTTTQPVTGIPIPTVSPLQAQPLLTPLPTATLTPTPAATPAPPTP